MAGDSTSSVPDAVKRGIEQLDKLGTADWVERPTWWYHGDFKYGFGETAVVLNDNSTVFCAKLGCGRTERNKEDEGQEKPSDSSKPSKGLLKCSRCMAAYCSRKCQVASWRRNHKRLCPLLAAISSQNLSEIQIQEIFESIFRRIRMYMNPYAVGKSQVLEDGFIFLRSNGTCEEWIYEDPLNREGKALQRNVRLQYLTVGEFDSVAFEDDFELVELRPKIVEALSKYDKQKHVVVVSVLKCGKVGIVTLPLIPDYGICSQLASMYGYADIDEPLQLTVDEFD